MDPKEQLKQLVDRGYRVELKGRVADDPTWTREVRTLPTGLPAQLVLPPDHELLGREVVRTRFWKRGNEYCCTEIRRMVYEGKPELIIP
jgi:hypothetical protein